MNEPLCPNCNVPAEDWQDMVSLWVVGCPRCGLVTNPHHDLQDAWTEWRELVESIVSEMAK